MNQDPANSAAGNIDFQQLYEVERERAAALERQLAEVHRRQAPAAAAPAAIATDRSLNAALRESEQRFSAAFADAPVGMILMKPTGEFIEANQAYLGMLGYSLEELAGKTSDQFTHPDDVEATHQYGEGFRQRAYESRVLEKRYIRKDGTVLWARASGRMRYDERDCPTQFIAVIEDITQQRRAEEALKNSEERLQLVVAQAPIAVCVMRGPGLVLESVNPHFENIFRGRVLFGKPLLEAVPELRCDLLDILQEVYRTGEPFAADEFNVPLDRDLNGQVEDYWFDFVYHPLRGVSGDVEGVVAFSVDVTAHVAAREALQRANRNLEEFAYVASHDLQEPLRMVRIYSELIAQNLGTQSEEELRALFGFVEQGVVRMDNLIRDLLSYSQSDHAGEEALTTGSADLNVALRLALTAVEMRVKECEAQVITCSLPQVTGDEGQLSHVFQNLLTNALKYRKADVPAVIEVNVVSQDGSSVVSVTDNGIGFDQSHAEQIFGLFKRLHRDSYPGTGLGLAICRRIVERYKGRMWAESREGIGSTFYFSLPAGGQRAGEVVGTGSPTD